MKYQLGFPCGNVLIEKISLKGRSLHILGKQCSTPKDYISFPTEDSPCSLIMHSADSSFELMIPCENQAGALYFDAASLLGDRAEVLKKYPSVVDGYLIAQNRGVTNYMEINRFLLEYFNTPVFD